MGLPRIRISQTTQILIGLALGVFVGWLVSRCENAQAIAMGFRPFSLIFLRMIKMIIGPLIFASLVSGIAGHGHLKSVGRIGGKALIYFEVVTTIALLVGLLVVNVMKPGVGVQLSAPMGHADIVGKVQPWDRIAQLVGLLVGNVTKPGAGVHADIEGKVQTWDQVVLHVVPDSVIRAMAEGDILQIVVFSVFFAVGVSLIGERGRILIEWCEAITQTMFKVTNVVMHYAPIGVGAAMAYTVGHSGFAILLNLFYLVVTLYVALTIFCTCVLIPIAWLFGVPVRAFIATVREPAILAFTTTSSESALPLAMERLEELGVPRKIISFILPLGYSFNLDGSTLYLTLATMFVAQAAGRHLTIAQQATMCLTLMLTSKGIAGVPRASLVIIAGTVASYGLPVEIVMLILGVDELMDMGRSLVNVTGNCLAAAVIARWEGVWDGRPGQPLDVDQPLPVSQEE